MSKKHLLTVVAAFFISLSLTAQQANKAVVSKKGASISKTAGNMGYSAKTADAASLKAKTTYSPIVTDASGLSCSAALSLVSPSICYAACTGISVTGSGGGAYTITFATMPPTSPVPAAAGTTFTGPTSPSYSVCPSVTTTYKVTVTNGPGCTASTQIVLNVAPKFSNTAISVSPSATLCGGASATLTDNTTVSAGTLSYQWDDPTLATTKSVTITPTGVGCTTYRVTVTNDLGGGFNTCDTVKTFTVCHSSPAVNITANPGFLLCPMATATLTADTSGGRGTGTIAWSDAGNTKTTVFPGNVAGTYPYNVTVTDANGCTASATQTITVSNTADPVDGSIVPNPSATICPGQTSTLNWVSNIAADPHTYTINWDHGFGTTSPTYDGTVNPDTYNVTVTNEKGCSATYNIVVGKSSTLVIAWSDLAICKGDNAILNTGYTGTSEGGTDTFNWTVTPIACGAPANTFGKPTVSCSVTATYSVTVTSSAGCTGSNKIVVTVNDPPTVTAPPNPYAYVCPTVSATLDAGPYVTYNGGATAGTFEFTGGSASATPTFVVNPASTTNYFCTVTDNKGCTAVIGPYVVDVKTVSVTVADATVCPGFCVTLTAVPVISPSSTQVYTWAEGTSTNIIGGATSATYSACPVITPTTATMAYFVTVNDGGCTATASCSISYKTPAPLTDDISTEVCYNTGVLHTFNVGATGTGTWTSPGGSPLGALSCTTCLTPDFTATLGNPATTQVYTYVVNVTDAQGCTNSANASITIDGLPSVTAPVAHFVRCPSDPCVTISANAPTGGVGPYSYNWGGGSISSGGNTATPCVDPVASSTYSVTITDSKTCTASATGIVVDVYQYAPSIVPTPSQICRGESSTLTLTEGLTLNGSPVAATFTYTWTDVSFPADNAIISTTSSQSPNINSTGTTNIGAHIYNVTITDNLGCSATQTTTITVNDIPTVTFPISTYTFCVNATSTISPNITCPGGSCTATWTAVGPGAPFSSGSAGDVNASNTAAAVGTTTYTIVVSSGASCTASASAVVTINAIPTPDAGLDQTVCIGDQAVIGGAPTGPGTSTFQWSASPADASLTTTTIANPTVIPSFTTVYTVTVTDNGCESTDQVTVTVNPLPTVNTTPTTVCSGVSVCLGSQITVTNAGATPSYTWVGSGGFTDNTANPCITATANGTYNVTVSDPGTSCSATGSFTVSVPLPMTDFTYDTTSTSCGLCIGNITVLAVVGGQSPYTFAMSGPSTPDGFGKFKDLCAQTYTVTITDAILCTFTKTVTIDATGGPTADTINVVHVKCIGGTGQASINIMSGTPPFTVTWNNPGATVCSSIGATGTVCPVTDLIAGSYTATVSDAGGCNKLVNVTITEPTALTLTTTPTNPLCTGAANGSACATAGGGTGTITYLWDDPSAATTACVNNLLAGTYRVTITDANLCTKTAQVVLTDPTPVTVNLVVNSNVLCNGGNSASITATVGGGSTPYLLKWNNGIADDNGAGPTFTHASLPLGTGNYCVTVFDGSGGNCSATACVTITEPAALTGTSTFTSSTCGNADGSVTANPIDGTAPYTVVISNSVPTIITTCNAVPALGSCIANNVASGSYNILITDANGCTYQYSQAVTDAGGPTATAQTNSHCTAQGASDGVVEAGVTAGGVAPFTYTWSGGIGNCTNVAAGVSCTITGVAAGTYSVTISDANNCNAVVSNVIVNEPGLLILAPTQSSVLCFGATSTLDPNASGGTGPYSYTWMPGGATTPTITGDPAVSLTYCVTVTDNSTPTPLSVDTCFSLSTPAQLVATASVTSPIACNGQTGCVAVTTTGGTLPITSILWTPGSVTTASYCNATAGTYTVVVTDFNNCTASTSVTLTQPTALVLTMSTPTHADCANPNGGRECVTISGGTPTYSYIWNNGESTSCVSSLSPGAYRVTVTDQNGCTASGSVTITGPLGIQLSIPVATVTNVNCFGGNTGGARAEVTGGGDPTVPGSYQFSWFKLPNLTTPVSTCASGSFCVLSPATAGTYVVRATDSKTCISSAQVTITEPTAVVAGPTTSTQPSCSGGNNGTATVVGPSGGTSGYSYQWDAAAGSQTTQTATGLAAGTYSCTVTDSRGCNLAPTAAAVTTATVTQPSAMQPSVTGIVHNNCSYSSEGGFDVTVQSGTGTPSYTFSCSNGQSSASPELNHTFTNLSASGATTSVIGSSTYVVTITDANGCSVTTSAIITAPTVLSASLSFTGENCTDDCEGSITATLSGGGGVAATYDWSRNGVAYTTTTQATITGVCFRDVPTNTTYTYTVTITDTKGCTVTASTSITQPTPVDVTITTIDDATCNGASDGRIIASGSGGTPYANPGYNYSWRPDPANAVQISTLSGINDSIYSGLTAGTYYVTVSDANQCSKSTAIVIGEPNPIAVTVTTTTPTICIGQSAVLDASVTTGGSPGSFITTWEWASNPGGYVTGIPQSTASVTVNPNVQGTYVFTVTVTDNSPTGTCRGVGQVTLVVRAPLNVVAAAPSPTLICSPDQTTLSIVTNSNTGGDTQNHNVTWTYTGSTPPGATVTFPSGNQGFSGVIAAVSGVITPSTTVTFTATLDDGGCTTPNAVATCTLLVNPSPTLLFSLSDDAECDRLSNLQITLDSASIQNNASTTQYYYYLSNQPNAGPAGDGWQLANSGVNFIAPSPSQDFVYNDGDGGTSNYYVQVKAITPGQGCAPYISPQSQIEIYQSPIVEIQIDAEYKEVFDVHPTTRVYLNHLDDFSSYDHVTWFFNDPRPSAPQTESTNTSVTHSYPQAGTYKIDLLVSNDHTSPSGAAVNCSGNNFINILVKPKTSVWIPDAFSPNGDGLNDMFMPQGRNIGAVEMYIYNRWGELVFSSTDMNKGWEGTTAAGSEASQDVYVYKIIVTDVDGTKYEPFVGRITLVK